VKPAAPVSSPGRPAPMEDDRPEGWRAVEFYRVDMSRRITAVVLLCPLPTIAGMLLLMRPMQGRVEPTPAWIALGILGLLLVAAGPLSMILSLRRVFQSDDYLLLRTDGLLEHVGDRSVLYPWDDLESVKYDETSGTVVLRARDGSEAHLAHPLAGIQPPALAARLDEVRRKAIWELI
jgi:hypothetical protein